MAMAMEMAIMLPAFVSAFDRGKQWKAALALLRSMERCSRQHINSSTKRLQFLCQKERAAVEALRGKELERDDDIEGEEKRHREAVRVMQGRVDAVVKEKLEMEQKIHDYKTTIDRRRSALKDAFEKCARATTVTVTAAIIMKRNVAGIKLLLLSEDYCLATSVSKILIVKVSATI